eukprot:TRINITY_DN24151_c0_g1_i1.p1 TRINITY_DN24151_c0_g1~~TRINITY_DN24151_c0_g1_i1.p1  ORF type:complete len:271 (-),score=39.65 TRINITY_DN24151_c0_g1_i1:145-957(-)
MRAPFTFSLILLASTVQNAPSGFKVIGAGWGKTGTTSLYEALSKLGYKVYHSTMGVGNSPWLLPWLTVLRSNSSQDLARLASLVISRGYDAITSEPGSVFTRQLLAAFPKAKVILTTRADPQLWFDSFMSEVYSRYLETFQPIRSQPNMFVWRALIRTLMSKTRNCAFRHRRWGIEVDAEACIESYIRHNVNIKRHVPARQLLHFRVEEGWVPLCDFLNVSVPSLLFPRAISSREGRKQQQAQMRSQIEQHYLEHYGSLTALQGRLPVPA